MNHGSKMLTAAKLVGGVIPRRRIAILWACLFVLAAPAQAFAGIWNTDDCRALVAKNLSWCGSDDCKAILGHNPDWCGSDDCKAIMARKLEWCSSWDCKAILSKRPDWCSSNACKAILARDYASCG